MKHNNWFWGVFFILAAVFVIASQVTSFMVIGFWTIVASVLLVAIFIKSLTKLNFFGVFLSLALAYMLYQHPLGLFIISPWLLLLAAVLLSIGFHFIFGRHIKHLYKCRHRVTTDDEDTEYHTIEDVDGNNPHVALSFGASSKYIHSDALKSGQFTCSFGTLSVYFDQAQLDPDGAELFVECSFGEVKLYFPREWRVIDKLKSSLGSVQNNIQRSRNSDSASTVTLTGGVSLGSIEIHYI